MAGPPFTPASPPPASAAAKTHKTIAAGLHPGTVAPTHAAARICPAIVLVRVLGCRPPAHSSPWFTPRARVARSAGARRRRRNYPGPLITDHAIHPRSLAPRVSPYPPPRHRARNCLSADVGGGLAPQGAIHLVAAAMAEEPPKFRGVIGVRVMLGSGTA